MGCARVPRETSRTGKSSTDAAVIVTWHHGQRLHLRMMAGLNQASKQKIFTGRILKNKPLPNDQALSHAAIAVSILKAERKALTAAASVMGWPRCKQLFHRSK